MFKLECVICHHMFCGGCHRETWTIPNRLVNAASKRQAEKTLKCCACSKVNDAQFWIEHKIPIERRVKNDPRQLDFFA